MIFDINEVNDLIRQYIALLHFIILFKIRYIVSSVPYIDGLCFLLCNYILYVIVFYLYYILYNLHVLQCIVTMFRAILSSCYFLTNVKTSFV